MGKGCVDLKKLYTWGMNQADSMHEEPMDDTTEGGVEGTAAASDTTEGGVEGTAAASDAEQEDTGNDVEGTSGSGASDVNAGAAGDVTVEDAVDGADVSDSEQGGES